MELFTSLAQQQAELRRLLGEVPAAAALPDTIAALSDTDVMAVLDAAAQLAQTADRVRVAASGVVAQRSTREAGHSGLAQSRGHRSPVSLVQQITGASRAQAAREVRVGESLFEDGPVDAGLDISEPGVDAGSDAGSGAGSDADADASGVITPPPLPWHAPLRAALLEGALTTEQHDAIRRGLGEPPVSTGEQEDQPGADTETGTGTDTDTGTGTGIEGAEDAGNVESVSDRHAAIQAANHAAVEAWRLAAEQLSLEATRRTVEELAGAARTVRDLLDPDGAQQRFMTRYEGRSFRMWVDAHGVHHGSFTFGDESAAWVRSMINAAMRPRRGGPRFVSDEDKEAARELRDDPRSNNQLTHDLLIDVMHAGTLATASQVFGVRQAGVRVVHVVDAPDPVTGATGPGRAFFEDEHAAVPVDVANRMVCNTGVVPVTVDRAGNPLNLGRTKRSYSSEQRIALSLRDGGCLWTGCDRPASYCEAHHIDEWDRDGGRTDIDRGALLCRFHHMQLHAGGWRITRDDKGPFRLHSRDGDVTDLAPRTARQLAWAQLTAVPTSTDSDTLTNTATGTPSVSPSGTPSVTPSVAFLPGKSRPPAPVPPDQWQPLPRAARTPASPKLTRVRR